MNEITNELLTKVLGFKAYPVKKEHIKWNTNCRKNDLVYETISDLQYCIDFDNLGKQCKIWAFNEGYTLNSGTTDDCGKYITYTCSLKNIKTKEIQIFTDNKREFDCIIKACNSILNNKK